MAFKNDLKGKRFGRLTVVEFSSERGNRRKVKWDCICDCGSLKTVSAECLTSGKTKSCGCLLKESRKRLAIKDRDIALYKNLYSHIRTRHLKKGFSEIDLLDFPSFVNISKDNCHYCGLSPENSLNDFRHDYQLGGRARKVSDTVVYYNGLDRLNSSIGYEINNVVPCCKKCNIAKNEFSYEDFKSWIVMVHNHFIK